MKPRGLFFSEISQGVDTRPIFVGKDRKTDDGNSNESF